MRAARGDKCREEQYGEKIKREEEISKFNRSRNTIV